MFFYFTIDQHWW